MQFGPPIAEIGHQQHSGKAAMGKEMEGGNQERRDRATEARDRARKPSEEGVTLGSSKQPDRSDQDPKRREDQGRSESRG